MLRLLLAGVFECVGLLLALFAWAVFYAYRHAPPPREKLLPPK